MKDLHIETNLTNSKITIQQKTIARIAFLGSTDKFFVMMFSRNKLMLPVQLPKLIAYTEDELELIWKRSKLHEFTCLCYKDLRQIRNQPSHLRMQQQISKLRICLQEFRNEL